MSQIISCPVSEKELNSQKKCDTIHPYETRSARNGNIITPEMNSRKGQTAFMYSGEQVWNSLPLHIKEFTITLGQLTFSKKD